jgi:hypothetical protein
MKSIISLIFSNTNDLKLNFVNDQKTFDYGLVGKKTPYIDQNGQRIHVGDFVEVHNSKNEKIWEHYVCHLDNTSDEKALGEKIFCIMGMAHSVYKYGTFLSEGESVKIIKSYKEAKHGDRHSLLHVLKTKDYIKRELPQEIFFSSQLKISDKNGASSGCVGQKTFLSDCFGNKLFIGDVVKVYDFKNECLGSYFVGEIPLSSTIFDANVLGLEEKCLDQIGFNSKKHRMELSIPFQDINIGDCCFGHTCISKE